MARGNDNVFTIYDLMDRAGYFRQNTANRDAVGPDRQSTYKGPVAYPKMMFHPEGKTKIVVPAEVISTPFGPQRVGEQREIIWQVAQDEVQEASLREQGWHDSPAKAIRAGGGEAPPVSSLERVAELEDEMARLRAELAAAKADQGEQAKASKPPLSAKTVPAPASV